MLYTYKLAKLVRDKIVAKFENDNIIVDYQILDDQGYQQALKNKIAEEAEEVTLSNTHDELVEELADLYEVMEALEKTHNINKKEIAAARQTKNESKGAFNERLYINTTTLDKDHPARQYCLNNPEKYPEVKK